MKVVTVLGTRPEIIRLSRLIPRLDESADHVLVHTGQNFDPQLSRIFFEELRLRPPDHSLRIVGESAADQIGQILRACEGVFQQEKPDRLLILGDTNSALAAFVAKRMGIPVFHMEAGNRSYDDRVPEEVNRRVIDHCSDILMPYTERSRANLLREGIPGHRIFVTGNPILEVIEGYRDEIAASTVLSRLGLKSGEYFLVTLHRAENVDLEPRLRAFTAAFDGLAERFRQPVIVSTHPRTAARLRDFGIGTTRSDVRFPEPFGFFDFITLEKNARCVLSDSGTVQEECAIFGIPNVTLRDVTERPETVECGSNILTGADPAMVMACVDLAQRHAPRWSPPPEYMLKAVADTVVRIVTGYHLQAPGA